jgi:hypothetical protein
VFPVRCGLQRKYYTELINISKELKKNILHSIIDGIFLYGGLMWFLTGKLWDKIKNKIRKIYVDILRRYLQGESRLRCELP